MFDDAVNILLVEDNDSHADLICSAFEDDYGDKYHVTVTETLSEAKAYLEDYLPSLVMADFVLPDGNGTELLLKRYTDHFPIIIMTSQGNENVAVDSMKAGAWDYIVKNEYGMDNMPHIARRVLREWIAVTSRKKTEAALQSIVKSSSGRIGQEFFDTIVQSLYEWFNADLVFIGELIDERKMSSLSMILHGEPVDSAIIDIENTPCEKVIEDGFGLWPDNVSTFFPNHAGLALNNASGYMGVSLKLRDGTPIGVIAVSSLKALPFSNISKDFLEILAARASAEIERKRAEEQIRFLGSITQQVSDGIIVIDKEFRITYINNATEKIYGYSFEELKGEHPDIIVGETNIQDLQNEIFSTVSRGDDWAGEFVNKRKDGSAFVHETRVSPLRDENGDIIFCIAVVHDITARRRAEQDAIRLEREIRQGEKLQAIGTLASGITHDFNNLLAGVMGAAELLAIKSKFNEDQKQLVATIIESAERAADLNKQLMTFAREDRQISVPVDMHNIISKVIGILKHTIDKRIKIIKNFNAFPSFTIGDPSHLQNAILNLAVNARDAMPDGGELTFETKNVSLDEGLGELIPGNYIVVSVEDNGTGISPVVIDRIFDPFFTTKPEGQGTGLGLSSVFGTVRSHKGDVFVESEVESGTVFSIYLPLSDNIASEQPDLSTEDIVMGKGRIMVVDDEPLLRRNTARVLTMLGYEVIEMPDGLSAVKYFEKEYQSVDLVILDMIMPKMNGPDTLKEMKRIKPDVNVLITSGYAESKEIKNIVKSGIAGYIQKPVKISLLSHTVADILGNGGGHVE